MLIRCSECGFTRQVNNQQIPAHSEFATCPKCKRRFRFRTVEKPVAAVSAVAPTGPETPENTWPQAGPPDSPQAAPAQRLENSAASARRAELDSQAGPKAESKAGPKIGPKTESEAPLAPRAEPASPEEPRDIWAAMEDFGNNWEREQEQKPARPDFPARHDAGAFDESAAEAGRDPFEPPAPDEFSDPAELGGSVGRADSADQDNRADPDEERRREALEAYRRQAALGDKPSLLANTGTVPWEYRGGFMTPQGFLRTMLLSFTRIPEFFSGIPARGSLGPALVFALLLRCVQFTVFFVFVRVRVQDAAGQITDTTLAQLADMGAPELIVTVLFVVILLQFLSAGITNAMIRLVCGDRSNFRLTFKVLAYSMTPLVFAIIPQIGLLIAETGTLVFFVLGLRHAFKLSWLRIALILPVPFIIVLLLSAQMLRVLGVGG